MVQQRSKNLGRLKKIHNSNKVQSSPLIFIISICNLNWEMVIRRKNIFMHYSRLVIKNKFK